MLFRMLWIHGTAKHSESIHLGALWSCSITK